MINISIYTKLYNLIIIRFLLILKIIFSNFIILILIGFYKKIIDDIKFFIKLMQLFRSRKIYI